jgi:superfamily II DNA or RNA helicase
VLDLRNWQLKCVAQAIGHYQIERHFFCLATPGAGKSIMAAEIGRRLLAQGKVDYIICLSPSRSICESIKRTFAKVIGKPFSGRIGSIGASLTYQSLLTGDHSVLADLMNSRVFVVLDEIHHCSGSEFVQGNAWGMQLIRQISSLATYSLSLSGTPWRTDGDPIAFANYGLSHERLNYHFEYGLRDSVNEGVCRLPRVTALDVTKITKLSSHSEHSFPSIAEFLAEPENSYTDLLFNENLIHEVLKRGVKRLSKLRKKATNAGGLIVASSYKHALILKHILEESFSQSTVLVSYKDDQSLEQIEEFKNGTTEWIVSISMISEGVDIPRLQVCCHLSDIKTELYFRQVLGRIIRITHGQSRECYFFTLAEESLVTFAERLEQEVSGSYIKEIIEQEDSAGFVCSETSDKSFDGELVGIAPSVSTQVDAYLHHTDSSQIDSKEGLGEAAGPSYLSIEGIRERVLQVLQFPRQEFG